MISEKYEKKTVTSPRDFDTTEDFENQCLIPKVTFRQPKVWLQIGGQIEIQMIQQFSTYFRDSIRRDVMVRTTCVAAADPPRKSDLIVLGDPTRRTSLLPLMFEGLRRYLRGLLLLLVKNAGRFSS